jgi:hypothetical protein
MRKLITLLIPCLLAGFLLLQGQQTKTTEPAWNFDATIIEACSCPMFCQCYFKTEPSAHHAGKHFCRFNMGYKVNKGKQGSVVVDGVKFWVAGDLGEDFGDGTADWAIVTFEPSVTKPQRDFIAMVLGHVYPVKWESFAVADDARIEWQAGRDHAVAKLDGGNAAEIVLKAASAQPAVVRDLRYFGAPRNTGFIMMPNEVEAYRLGDKKFEYKGTTGFMITYNINSKDVAKPAAKLRFKHSHLVD